MTYYVLTIAVLLFLLLPAPLPFSTCCYRIRLSAASTACTSSGRKAICGNHATARRHHNGKLTRTRFESYFREKKLYLPPLPGLQNDQSGGGA